MKSGLKIYFTDWITEEPEQCLFYKVLAQRYNVSIDPNPELLLCSVFGKKWMSFDCKKLWYTYERIPPFPTLHDYSISYEPTSDRNYQLPYFRVFPKYKTYLEKRIIEESSWQSKKDVNYVYTNWAAEARSVFYQRLSRKLHIDSGGKHFNNMGGPIEDKYGFLKDYKFTIAFENTAWPGYTTEKLFEAYDSGTVPIYFGDPTNTSWLNPAAVIRYEGPSTFDAVQAAIVECCKDFNSYKAIYEQPLLIREPEEWSEKSIGDFLEYVVNGPRHAGRHGRLYLDYHFERKEAWMGLRVIDWERRWLLYLKDFFFPVKYVKEKIKSVVKKMLRPPQAE